MKDKIKKRFFLTLGIISLTYYLICIAFAHIGVSWLWIWPALSAFCFIRFIMIFRHIQVPRIIRTVYYIAVIIFLASFIAIESLIISHMSEPVIEQFDYIIVLGAAVRNGQPTTPMRLRMNTALEYMSENGNTICIASGGQGSNEYMAEGDCIADFLIANGIDESRVIRETDSVNTEQNIKYSFENIPYGSSVGIVTNSFHIFRSEITAKLLGYNAFGVPAPTYIILGIHYTVREYFAVVELLAKYILSSNASLSGLFVMLSV